MQNIHITHRPSRVLVYALAAVFLLAPVEAADWPQWRFDAGRTAVTPHELPADLHLHWFRQLPTPDPAWGPRQRSLQFDASYEPVVMGRSLFVGSMVSDSVTAYDTETGAEKWRFYADAPVRLAPIAHEGRLYFVSDDGFLYCLHGEDGSLLWKSRGGPTGQTVIGNDRLIGMWPARGGPVLYGGEIYFAAGIWPFMGTFIHALDAENGAILWTNSGSGSDYLHHSHGSSSFGGVAPQGYIAATEDRLLVAGGRSVPGVYDRKTGQFKYFYLWDRRFGQHVGGYDVTAVNQRFLNGGVLYRTQDGEGIMRADNWLCTPDAVYYMDGNKLVSAGYPEELQTTDEEGNKSKRLAQATHWEVVLDPPPRRIFLKASNRLYGTHESGLLVAIDVAEESTVAVSWTGQVQSSPRTMVAAAERLFVVTTTGGLYCFGAEERERQSHELVNPELPKVRDAWTSMANKILADCGTVEGYCLSLGLGSGRLVEELVRQAKFHIIVVEPEPKKVETLRQRMDAAGLYGVRVAAFEGDAFDFDFPPYLATLVVSEDVVSAGFDAAKHSVKRLFEPLRPYGGTAYLHASQEIRQALEKWIAGAQLQNAQVSQTSEYLCLRRPGPLPGSANWSHNHADSANSMTSKDQRVRLPLGLLWFGDPPNPAKHHTYNPFPQVAGGRLFTTGEHSQQVLQVVDVYTGRPLWNRAFEGMDTFQYQFEYVALEDSVYVKSPTSCLRLDPVTGTTVKEFTIPVQEGQAPPHWGTISVWGDLLIATVSPMHIPDSDKQPNQDPAPAMAPIVKEDAERPLDPHPVASQQDEPKGEQQVEITLEDIPGAEINTFYATAGGTLVAMDRLSGALIWSRRAKHHFRHDAIAVAAGKVFCIDAMNEKQLAYLQRRGYQVQEQRSLCALDADSGNVLWQTHQEVFSDRLSYSQEHDILLQAKTSGKHMIAYRGEDGSVLWENRDRPYQGPTMLHRNTIITSDKNGYGIDLLTGERRTFRHPLTGESEPWTFTRSKGCGTVLASEHLLTFRSAAAAFFDLAANGGTGHFGGFRSGCTSNLVVANGVFCAPDYTHGCSCNYQNQASLAMIHMPQAEMWTFSAYERGSEPVQRVGINFGAPGDRRGENGTLWLEYPHAGGPSPELDVALKGGAGRPLRFHASCIQGGNPKWVAASALSDLTGVTITLNESAAIEREHTIRLYFAELEDLGPGGRVFSVSLQGERVLDAFDIVKEAGGQNRCVTKQFKHIVLKSALEVLLTPAEGSEAGPLLCGIEVVAEDQ